MGLRSVAAFAPIAISLLVGCADRQVEVRGSTRTDLPLSAGPLSVLVVDAEALDRGDTDPVLAVVSQGEAAGDFAVTVPLDGETVEAFAVRDDDHSGTCSKGDSTARVRITIGADAARADLPELVVASGETCPSYAEQPF